MDNQFVDASQADNNSSLGTNYQESSFNNNPAQSAQNQTNFKQDNAFINSVMSEYESIYKAHGVKSADLWLEQQVKNQYMSEMSDSKKKSDPVNVQIENQAVMQEIQDKHKDVCTVPAVQQAMEAFLKFDIDPNSSLKEQNFPMAMDYMSGIYNAGLEAGMNLRNQNDHAKSRMGSSINNSVPSSTSGKVFSRADIRKMSLDSFEKNERKIFDQLAKGLIK